MSEQPAYEQSGGGSSGPRAGFWRRFAAVLVDAVLFAVVFGILGAFMSRSAANGLSTLAGLIYFTYFEGSASGQTVGKKALGIRVIDFKTGGAVGYGRAFIRYIGRFVSTIALLLGYLWMLWDKEKQTWHDKMAGAVVVPTSSYPVG